MSWKDKPTLINSIQPRYSYIFIDESGCITDYKNCFSAAKEGKYSPLFRDSVFSLNAVLLYGRFERQFSNRLNDFRARYGLDDSCHFHGSEIDSWSGEFANFPKSSRSAFAADIVKSIVDSHFIMMAFGVEKRQYFNDAAADSHATSNTVIERIYRDVFCYLDSVLNKLNRKAVVVIEETTPELDRKILRVFTALKKRQRITCLFSLYFACKNMERYPAGSVLADLTSKSTHGWFKNVEYLQFSHKLYCSPNYSQSGLWPLKYRPVRRKILTE